MSRPKIVTANPEGAASALRQHLDAFWAERRPEARGWRRFQLEPLRWVVCLPATSVDGNSTHFFVRLDGRRYDGWPPEVQFVDPDNWEPATSGRWWPATDPDGDPSRPRWFELHPHYDFEDDDPRPLICFAHALGFYESDHGLAAGGIWLQGRHTVAATLDDLAEILSPPYFLGVAP